MKQQRKSLQSLQAKIRTYKKNFGTINGTPSETLPKKCCMARKYVAWRQTYEIYFERFGSIEGKEWRKKKEWFNILDSLLTKSIRILQPECAVCGKIPKHCRDSQASHILPKSLYPGLRYEIENVLHMCNNCHMNFWHKNPIEAYLWFNNNYPEKVDKLLEIKQKKPYNTKDFNKKQIYFQKILDKYSNNSI